MHSLAIFSGFLIFGWGAHGLKLVLFIVRSPAHEEGVHLTFWGRWTPHLVAAATLPPPIMLSVAGGTLVQWGFTDG